MQMRIVARQARIPASSRAPKSTPSVSARFVPSGSSRSDASWFAGSAGIICHARTIIEALFFRRWNFKFAIKLKSGG